MLTKTNKNLIVKKIAEKLFYTFMAIDFKKAIRKYSDKIKKKRKYFDEEDKRKAYRMEFEWMMEKNVEKSGVE